MKSLKLVSAIVLLLLLGACQKQQNKQEVLSIATNSWIGYAPLFYADKSGELAALGFRLITTTSLAEAADLYDVAKVDMVTTTQHEFVALKKSSKDITPVILLDRSFGGDMILANRSLEALASSKQITAYLEVDSINADLLQSFLQKYGIDVAKLQIINKNQKQIETLKLADTPTLIVTYAPYDVRLRKQGYKIVASTKEIDDLLVVDALCMRKALLHRYKARIAALKQLIDREIEQINKEPKASYEMLKRYLDNIEYGEYLAALSKIKWVNHPSKELLERIEHIGYSKEEVLP